MSRAVSNRRRFLKAVAGGGAALAAPAVRADTTVHWRLQTAWPRNDIFHEYALDYAETVNTMSEGRLRLHVFPVGAIVKGFDLLDTVHQGLLDAAHTVPAYWHGKHAAFSLFGSGPSFGMDANMLLAWFKYGGGEALYRELHESVMQYDVRGFLYGPMPTQPLGWFKRPIQSVADFQGLKFRTVGLAMEVFKELGAIPIALPGGAIVPSLRRGLIDAAEFNNVSSDRALGLPEVAKVCMLKSHHQVTECFELLFNKRRYDALPEELRAVLRTAAEACSARMSWQAIDRYSRDYALLREEGVQFHVTPLSVQQAQLAAWDTVLERRAKANPFFARVLASQRDFAARAVAWAQDVGAPLEMAYHHFFGGPEHGKGA